MATLTQRNGSWLAQVRKADFYESKTFKTKKQAIVWSAELEAKIEGGKYTGKSVRPLVTDGEVSD